MKFRLQEGRILDENGLELEEAQARDHILAGRVEDMTISLLDKLAPKFQPGLIENLIKHMAGNTGKK